MLSLTTNVSIKSIKENTKAIKFQTVDIENVKDKGDSNTKIINGLISLHSIYARSHLNPPQPHPFSTSRESGDGFRFYRWQSQSLT